MKAENESHDPPLNRGFRRLTDPGTLVLVYLALMPLAWPRLPANLHFADLLFPLVALQVLRHRRMPIEWRWLDAAVLLYLLAPLPSLLTTPDLAASSLAMVKRGYLAAVYLVFSVYVRDHGRVVAARVLVRSAAVFCAIGLVAMSINAVMGDVWLWATDANEMPYFGEILRLRAGTEGPEMLGNYLTVVVAFLIALRAANLESPRRWLAESALVAVAMFFTLAHAVVGFLTAALVASRPIQRAAVPRVVRVAATTFVILVAVLVNVMLVATVRDLRIETGLNAEIPAPLHVHAFQAPGGAEQVALDVSYNPMSYFLLKRVALSSFGSAPLTGTGVGTFHERTAEAVEAGRLHEWYRASDPHSTPLGALAETGVLGGLAVLAVFGTALIGWKRRPAGDRGAAEGGAASEWLTLAAKAAVLGLLVNSLNADVMHMRFLWIALAFART